MMITEDRRSRPHLDIPLLLITYALAIFGVLCIAIATFDPDKGTDLSLLNYIVNSSSASWQSIFCLVSPVILAVVLSVPYELYRARAFLFYYAVLILLVIVLGASSVRGINAWLKIGSGRTLQPSEFAKIAVILVLSRAMAHTEKPMSTFRDFARLALIYGVPAGLTLLQGETGTVIVITMMFYMMLLFGGADWRFLLIVLVVGLGAIIGVFAYLVDSGSTDYRVLRILSFINPQEYYQSSGYQIINSQMAIGAGGMTGIGMFVVGSMSQLNYVPENSTDFIFSTIGEAFGFIGCVAVLMAYLFLILRMLYLARFTKDKFGQLVIIGVMSMMATHIFQNIAMCIGLMPITGIPLPFLSYGGSNFVTNMIGIGLVLNVTKNRSSMPSYATPLPPVHHRRKRKFGLSI